MSVEAIVWAFKVPMEDPSAKLVLVAIANFADQDGRAWPSQKKLAEMCSMSERTVRAAMARLEDRGIIARSERRREDGGRTTDMVTLIPAARSAGGAANATQPPRQTNTPPPPAAASGLTLFEPSEVEPSVNQTREAREIADEIWKASPLPSRKRSSQAQLLKALQAAVRRGKNLAAIRRAVEAYFEDPEIAKEDYRFAKAIHRVVENDHWETWADAEGIHHIETSRPDWQQRRMMEGWKALGRSYWTASFGPAPDEPGCVISPEIMAEFGYIPPRRAEA